MSSPESPTASASTSNPPVRTKRRYGASCELCRRRKRKCPGRDKDGNSLCTHCAEVGVECIFPPNGQTSRARKAMAAANVSSEADKLKDYIRHLASTSATERDRLLSRWADEPDDLHSPLSTFKVPFEETKPMHQLSVPVTEQRPSKRRKLSSSSHPHAQPSNSRTDSTSPSPSLDPDPEGSESSWRPESALRLSLNPRPSTSSSHSRQPSGSTPTLSKPTNPYPNPYPTKARERENVKNRYEDKEEDDCDSQGEDEDMMDQDEYDDRDRRRHRHSYHGRDLNTIANKNSKPKGTLLGATTSTINLKSTTTISPNASCTDSEPHLPYATKVDTYLDNVGISVDDVSIEDRDLLLNNYFCWQGPRNSVVDQALFERSMKENDPQYFTPFLFYSVCAHTCRHVPQLKERVSDFGAKALVLLPSELVRPSSIPTIQGLLLLSSHFAARGMYGQSWNLAGLAVGMMTDMGCHLEQPLPSPSASSSKLSSLSSSSAKTLHEMRIRMFWATFIWDKIISLALNRPAHLSYEQRFPPYPQPKDSSDIWEPLLSIDSPPALFSYQPQPSHVDKCFYEAYRFLDEIHYHLYQRHRSMRPAEIKDFVCDMRSKLLAWQEEACKEVVFLDVKSRMKCPPPPHIIQLNLVIRVMWILLFRPFYYRMSMSKKKVSSSSNTRSSSPTTHASSSSDVITTSSSTNSQTQTQIQTQNQNQSLPSIPHAIPTCERAAEEINDLFLMCDQLYPISRATYIIIFAAFLAATIDLALADKQRGAVVDAVGGMGFKGGEERDVDRDRDRDTGREEKERKKTIKKLQHELGTTLGRLALANRVLAAASNSVIPGMNSSVAKLQKQMKMMLEGSRVWTGEVVGAKSASASGGVVVGSGNGNRVVSFDGGQVGEKAIGTRVGSESPSTMKRIWEEEIGVQRGQADIGQERRQWQQQMQQPPLSAALGTSYKEQPISKVRDYATQSLSDTSSGSATRHEATLRAQSHAQSGYEMLYHDSAPYPTPTPTRGYRPSTSSSSSSSSSYHQQQQPQIHPSISHIPNQPVVPSPMTGMNPYHEHVPAESPVVESRYEFDYHTGTSRAVPETAYAESTNMYPAQQHLHHPHAQIHAHEHAQVLQQQQPPPYEQSLEPQVAVQNMSDLHNLQGFGQVHPNIQWQDTMMSGTGMEGWNAWFWPGDGYFGTDDSWFNSNLAARTVV
ncbi:hypothetical protein VKT23_013559 [Stygiomarasmius scandens]|uniref:Zn(2)-C6 fungal-type domain-containing protein n=1 Tax=Marasmiellus scandens TaxID=2682957 RepID=A0ABR1J7K9_9AGAR